LWFRQKHFSTQLLAVIVKLEEAISFQDFRIRAKPELNPRVEIDVP
jgi:hypothetical protein